MLIGLIKERKDPPDKRVALTPTQCAMAMEEFPDLKIIVESSAIRIFPDQAYMELGVEVVNDISNADILIGVKEVPIDALIPNKKYLFFSHTLKAQPYNRELLCSILEKDIQLVDHETLVYSSGSRVLGFGRYAGIVGAYNGFYAWGERTGAFTLKRAFECADLKALQNELNNIVLPESMNILLTGNGKVAHGVMEILDHAGIEKVDPDRYLNNEQNARVYTQLGIEDYNIPPAGKAWNKADFYDDPSEYSSGLKPFLEKSNMYISGHYWDNRAPQLITANDLKNGALELQVVADISCDIVEPIACTIRPSTIENPIYGYHRAEQKECDLKDPNAIVVMAVDNLPCELPKDASEGFGEMLLSEVLPELIKENSEMINRSSMTKNGALTENFEYLQDYVNG